jgi:uncharacterized protein
MGHRHSSEELCSHGAATGVDVGYSAAGEGAVSFTLDTEREGQAPLLQAVAANGEKSVGVRVSLFVLSFYKAYFSAWFAGTCKYDPTCSRYAYEAIERFGVRRGGWLGLKRLLRCHPFTRKFGYDPVPEKWEKMRANSDVMGKTREAQS